MGTEVMIVGAKRNAVLGVRPRPVTWKSVVEFFDVGLKSCEGLSLGDWLDTHTDWEVKQLAFDPPGNRWVLLAQRPLA